MLKLWALLAASAAPPDPACRDLKALIDGLIAAPAFTSGKLGVHVVRLDDKTVLYDHDGDRQFVPASNVKLVSTAAALHFLGPDFRFSTDVFGAIEGDKVATDLYVRGNGDPWLVPERIWYLAQRLYFRGIRAVKGDIVIDDSFFDGPRLAGGAEQDTSSSAYMAPVGAVSVGFNALLVHVLPGPTNGADARIMVEPPSDYARVKGSVRTASRGRTSIHVDVVPDGDRSVIFVSGKISIKDSGRGYWRRIDNPPVFAGEVLKRQLEQVGIEIKGKVKTGKVPADESGRLEKLVELASPRLAELVARVNKHSNNFMAEQLAHALGAALYGAPGNWEKGKRGIERFLAEQVELEPSGYVLGNASGLHDVNRMTPRQLVRVLEYMWHQPSLGPEYVASMAVASGSGTLSDRMQGSDAVGLLRAKTGTLSIASALSGYVTGKQGEPLAFSIVVNDYRTRIEELWAAQDAVGAALAALDSSCGTTTAMSRQAAPRIEAAAQ